MFRSRSDVDRRDGTRFGVRPHVRRGLRSTSTWRGELVQGLSEARVKNVNIQSAVKRRSFFGTVEVGNVEGGYRRRALFGANFTRRGVEIFLEGKVRENKAMVRAAEKPLTLVNMTTEVCGGPGGSWTRSPKKVRML